MRPRLLIVALGLLICNQPVWAGPNYHGRVLRVKPGELAVTVGTEEFEFVVTARTRIEVEGKPARLEALRKGFVAVVEAERLGDVHIARRIVARKPRIFVGTGIGEGGFKEEFRPLSQESRAFGSRNPTPRSDLNLDRR